jgi:protease I
VGKHALFVVPDRYIEAEYRVPRRILEELGASVTVASWSLDDLLGTTGNLVQPELQLGDVRTGDYDAIVLVGGDGVRPTESEIQRIVREAIAEGKVVAAICGSQAILAYAGVVEAGGVARGTVERDGLIVTASGSAAAREFGTTVASLLAE